MAQAPISQTRAKAPAPGTTMTAKPNSTEIAPERISSH